jgi:hypothetical protein
VESLEDRAMLSVGEPLATTPVSLDSTQWTVMVYMDGDNDLEAAGIGDFLEMASVGSDSNIKVVVQFDRTAGHASTYDNWTDTRRGLVSLGSVPNASWGASIGEANMADSATLVNFVDWAMASYPAQHYALILWGHGDGWRSTTTQDGASSGNANGGDAPDNRDVGLALASIPENIDLFGNDRCLMAMLECAYPVRNEATVYVGSEQIEPNDGWAYNAFLADLKANPTWTAAQLATDVVDQFRICYGGAETLSAIDLSVVGADCPSGLAAAVSNLASAIMSDATTDDYRALATHRDAAPYYADHDFRDLGTFLTSVANDADLTRSIRDAADTASSAYKSAILQNHSGASDGATGLSIYFPAAACSPDPEYASTVIAFANDTRWDEFLEWWGDAGEIKRRGYRPESRLSLRESSEVLAERQTILAAREPLQPVAATPLLPAAGEIQRRENSASLSTVQLQGEEFCSRSLDRRRANGSAVIDRIDLLSVVAHELGHVAGLTDLVSAQADLMSETLSAGRRLTPTASDVDAVLHAAWDWTTDETDSIAQVGVGLKLPLL